MNAPPWCLVAHGASLLLGHPELRSGVLVGRFTRPPGLQPRKIYDRYRPDSMPELGACHSDPSSSIGADALRAGAESRFEPLLPILIMLRFRS